MASRDLLHKSKIEDFKNWLTERGWTIENTKGEFEVLRATKPKSRPLIIFRRIDTKEHYTVQESHVSLVYAFINQNRKKDKMGKLLTYASEKDELDRKIADEVRKLCLEGLNYDTAIEKAKEIYSERRVKESDRVK